MSRPAPKPEPPTDVLPVYQDDDGNYRLISWGGFCSNTGYMNKEHRQRMPGDELYAGQDADFEAKRK